MSSESFEGWPYIELHIIVLVTSIQGGRASFLFFFPFFSFLTPLPLKQTQRHAAGGEGAAVCSAVLLPPHASQARYWPDWFDWTNESCVWGQMSQWSCVQVPCSPVASRCLSPTLVCRRQPQLRALPATDLLHNGALESAGRCHSVTSSFFHSPPPPHHILLSNILGLPIGSLI